MVNEDSQGWVQAPQDGSGKRLDTRFFSTTNSTVVHREVVHIGGTTISAIATVTGGKLDVNATISSARVDHSLVVSPTAGSFNVTVSNPGTGYRNVTSNTAASFNVTVSGLTSAIRNVTSNTAASFNTTSLLPGYARVQSATAASALVTAKSLSLSAGSFNATVFAPGVVRAQSATAASFLATVAAPGYVRAQNPTTQASFLVLHPGVLRVTNLTAASFLVTSTGGSGFRNVTSNTAASFNVRADHSLVVSPSQASFLVSHPGVLRVTNLTAASFLVTSTGGSGFRNVTSNTAASFLVTAKALSLTSGSFLAQVSVPAFVNVKGPTTRGSTVVQADHSLVVSGTAASFLVTAKAVSLTNASFLAQVSVPAFVNIKGPTTRGSTIVQADHSLVIASNASFSVSVPGILRYPTTRGSTVDAVDHSLVVSTTAGSFLATVVNIGTARSTWPTAEANNASASTFITDLSRRLIVMPYAFPENSFSTSILVSSTIPIVAVNAVSGQRAYITYLGGANSSGTATQVDVNMTQVTAGRNLFDSWIAASGGGFSAPQPFPIRGNTNASVVVRVTPTVSRVQFTIVGYNAP